MLDDMSLYKYACECLSIDCPLEFPNDEDYEEAHRLCKSKYSDKHHFISICSPQCGHFRESQVLERNERFVIVDYDITD